MLSRLHGGHAAGRRVAEVNTAGHLRRVGDIMTISHPAMRHRSRRSQRGGRHRRERLLLGELALSYAGAPVQPVRSFNLEVELLSIPQGHLDVGGVLSGSEENLLHIG